ncbi:hypothetical protein LCGC14_2426400 [marine sediment metagenome]|uniref:Cytochrome c domain-containing protein n=1 Tax=marine sediment metagenome TaxID=412755 RepID=A0A0F9E0A2_9ZZZZ
MNRRTSSLRRALAAGVAGFCAAAAPLAAQTDQDTGRALYEANCAACHGADLAGQPDWRTPGPDGILPAPPHDETGHTWHHGDGMLSAYVLDGASAVLGPAASGFASGMPAFAGQLTKTEVTAILDYIKSTWPPHIREVQATRTQAETMKDQ